MAKMGGSYTRLADFDDVASSLERVGARTVQQRANHAADVVVSVVGVFPQHGGHKSEPAPEEGEEDDHEYSGQEPHHEDQSQERARHDTERLHVTHAVLCQREESDDARGDQREGHGLVPRTPHCNDKDRSENGKAADFCQQRVAQ